MAVSGLARIRNKNTLAVFHEIISSDGVLRAEISERTGISLMTVGKIVDALLNRGIIYEKEYPSITAGRKPSLALPNTGQWWSCVFGLTDAVTVSMLTLDLRVVFTARVSVSNNDWEGALREAIRAVQNYAEKHAFDPAHFMGIGVSAPAPYDAERDRVKCPSRPGIEGLRLGQILGESFCAPMYVDEDVKLAALAALDAFPEYRSADVFYMHMGVGVGSVLLRRGEIYRGEDNYAGDIGQMLLASNRTVENMLARTAVQERIAVRGFEIEQVRDNMPPELAAIVADIAHDLARAVYNATCMFSPRAVIVDQDCLPENALFFRAFQEEYARLFFGYERRCPPVHFTADGMQGAVRGLGYQLRKKWLLQEQ